MPEPGTRPIPPTTAMRRSPAAALRHRGLRPPAGTTCRTQTPEGPRLSVGGGRRIGWVVASALVGSPAPALPQPTARARPPVRTTCQRHGHPKDPRHRPPTRPPTNPPTTADRQQPGPGTPTTDTARPRRPPARTTSQTQAPEGPTRPATGPTPTARSPAPALRRPTPPDRQARLPASRPHAAALTTVGSWSGATGPCRRSAALRLAVAVAGQGPATVGSPVTPSPARHPPTVSPSEILTPRAQSAAFIGFFPVPGPTAARRRTTRYRRGRCSCRRRGRRGRDPSGREPAGPG